MLNPNSPSQRELQYLERIDFDDKNGSIDIYNPDDEIIQTNPQNYNHGWAHKLAEAIQFTLSDYGTDKVILVCHSMGGLAVRELLTGANGSYPSVSLSQIDRVITIDTPHAGSPLARAATVRGRFLRLGWFSFLLNPVLYQLERGLDAMTYLGNIDIKGEAVRDMDPFELEGGSTLLHTGTHFLKNLSQTSYSLKGQLPDIYTIFGEVEDFPIKQVSKALSMYSVGSFLLKNERGDGVVLSKSQRSYPLISNSLGIYQDDNNDGFIDTQERLFEYPEFVSHADFYDPLNALDKTEVQIEALHMAVGGVDGAPNVASGIINGDYDEGKNYILKYIDYKVPEIELMNKTTIDDQVIDRFEESDFRKYTHDVVNQQQYALTVLIGMDNVTLPRSVSVIHKSYEMDTPQTSYVYEYTGHLVRNAVRPFEDMSPHNSGFLIGTGLGVNPALGGIIVNEVKVVNSAGIQSNTVVFNAYRPPLYSSWYSTAYAVRTRVQGGDLIYWNKQPWISHSSYGPAHFDAYSNGNLVEVEQERYHKMDLNKLRKFMPYLEKFELWISYVRYDNIPAPLSNIQIYEVHDNWDNGTWFLWDQRPIGDLDKLIDSEIVPNIFSYNPYYSIIKVNLTSKLDNVLEDNGILSLRFVTTDYVRGGISNFRSLYRFEQPNPAGYPEAESDAAAGL